MMVTYVLDVTSVAMANVRVHLSPVTPYVRPVMGTVVVLKLGMDFPTANANVKSTVSPFFLP